jgi:hypothetical protein
VSLDHQGQSDREDYLDLGEIRERQDRWDSLENLEILGAQVKYFTAKNYQT